MSKPKRVSLRPISFLLRIMAALLACISLSVITVFIEYVPAAERMENTYYYPLWYSFLIILLIHLAIVIFLTIPLSILTDAISISLAQRFKGGIHPVVSVVAGCVLLAGLSGMLFSIFVYRGDTFLYMGAIRHMSIITVIFACWQFALWAGARWLENLTHTNTQSKTG